MTEPRENVPPEEAAEAEGDDEVLEGELVSGDAVAGAWSDDEAPTEESAESSLRALARVEPTDALTAFMQRIRRYPPLADSEERDLARRVRDTGDSAAARRLVVHNLRLVVAIAYDFRRAWNNVLDLVQEGSVGLVTAVQRWDPERGARFATYAAYWIRAYILRFVLTNYRLVHTGNTRAGRRLFFQLERERARLRLMGIDPTVKALAERIGVEEKDVREVSRALDAPEMSFDTPVREDGRSLSESLSDEEEGSPEDLAAGMELRARLGDITARFRATLKDDRERALWDEHLLAEEPVSLSELGARFGVSKQRMGQVVNAMKERFRLALAEDFGPDVDVSTIVRESN